MTNLFRRMHNFVWHKNVLFRVPFVLLWQCFDLIRVNLPLNMYFCVCVWGGGVMDFGVHLNPFYKIIHFKSLLLE